MTDGADGVVRVIHGDQGGDSSMSQLLYELCFCLWSVSLCEEARHDFMSCGAVPILAQQVNYRNTEVMGSGMTGGPGWALTRQLLCPHVLSPSGKGLDEGVTWSLPVTGP